MGQKFTHTAFFHPSLLLLSGILCLSVQAADEDYIAAVKADVAEFTTHEFQAPPDSKWVGSGDDAGENSAAQLKDLAGFSDYLQKKSPGSYIFYRKLPTEYKEKLHSDYLSTGDLDRIKEDIFKYSREVKRN